PIWSKYTESLLTGKFGSSTAQPSIFVEPTRNDGDDYDDSKKSGRSAFWNRCKALIT
ncbi:35509_t:CDS:1, partial [Racocetra persica]